MLYAISKKSNFEKALSVEIVDEEKKIYPNSKEKKDKLMYALQIEISEKFSKMLQRQNFTDEDKTDVERFVYDYIRKNKFFFVDEEDEKGFVTLIVDDIFGMGALESLIKDPTITEILVNGPNKVYYEREGRTVLSDIKFRNQEVLYNLANKILAPLNRKVDERNANVDARLEDGSRVAIILPPLTLTGPEINIRKFHEGGFTFEDYMKEGSMTKQMADFLTTAVECGANILVVGGTGTGKTTLLNALSSKIPEDREIPHIITIEDSAELQLKATFLSSWETRNASAEGVGGVTSADLLKHALRSSPRRIIVGEIRDSQIALALQNAVQTGHDGCMSTLHASSSNEAANRFAGLVAGSGEMSLDEAKDNFANSFDIIVVVSRVENVKENCTERKIVEIVTTLGFGEAGKKASGSKDPCSDEEKHKIFLDTIFKYDYAIGKHICTGKIPAKLISRATREGRQFNPSCFLKAELTEAEQMLIDEEKMKKDSRPKKKTKVITTDKE